MKKKKYTVGEGADFITRKQAMTRLQLTLKDFRKLCILKGVYPREPKSRKTAQKGKVGVIQTLYAKKDILFLGADPMIWDMRKFKLHCKKKARARGMRDMGTFNSLIRNRPQLDLDHIVRERYPSFIDALKDLDDCLTLLFLFADFPSLKCVPSSMIQRCRRLTVEFLHLVIEARALRKVFVSIKGYYFQVELRGQTITWIIPHHFGYQPEKKEEVDFQTMSYFVEFYTVMLGFVNFRLYQQHNLFYPPRLSKFLGDESEKKLVDKGAYFHERMASLNVRLSKSKVIVEEEETQLDSFALSEDPDQLEKIQKETARLAKLKKLFEGTKIFINREVPREPLVICIRALGGEVSWDKVLFVGSTFDEDDETITHHIVDRPKMDKQYISRYYVQPQWVFDSVNAAQLLPTERYLIGAVLPPHLSPFNDPTRDERYKPPEELDLKDLEVPTEISNENNENDDYESSDEDAEDNSEVEEEEEEEKEEAEKGEVSEKEEEEDIPDEEKERMAKKKKMAVKRGTITKEDPLAAQEQEREEHYLKAKLVRNKHRRLYRSMMMARKKRMKEVKLLTMKRDRLDEKSAAEKKEEKRQQRKAAAALEA